MVLRRMPLLLALGLICASVSALSAEPRDAAQREEFLRRARSIEERGSAFSQYMIGVSYLQGKEIEQDTEEAVRWFRKGALMGDHASQLCMAHAYRFGEGIAQDPMEALAWSIVAGGPRNTNDAESFRDLERSLTREQTRQAKQRSEELRALVAEGEKIAQARHERIQREIEAHDLKQDRPAAE